MIQMSKLMMRRMAVMNNKKTILILQLGNVKMEQVVIKRSLLSKEDIIPYAIPYYLKVGLKTKKYIPNFST